MKKRWTFGLVLFASVALNVTLASMMLGQKTRQYSQPMRMALERLDSLQELPSRKAFDILKENRAKLREQIHDIGRLRQEVKAYIASDAYDRAEAEKKLAELRLKTTALQEAAQRMILDISDKLTPEERAAFLKHTD